MSTNSVTTPPACASKCTTVESTAAEPTAAEPVGSGVALATPSVISTSSVLVRLLTAQKHTKYHKNLQWWYFGPVVLAIVMFLLMGTIFERRIESLWRRILERRQAVLAPTVESQQPLLNTNSLHTVKTPSQRSLSSCKAGTTTTSGDNDGKLETINFCCLAKKEHRDDDLIKKDITERTVPLLT